MCIPSKEQLKARSKYLAKLLQEKYNLKVSNGHCLQVVSQLFGYKNWNTANALASDEATETVPEPDSTYAPWLEALTKGYQFSIEQPYLKETFQAGGVTAQRSSERGVRSLDFTFRIDEGTRRIVAVLPLDHSVSTTDAVIGLQKQLYQRREREFASKLGGRAEDLSEA